MAEDRVVLAIDTSTVVNVGLARGAQVLATATVEDRMAHVEQLTPLIRDCLAQAGLRLARRRPDRRRPRTRTVHRAAGGHRHRPDPGRGGRTGPARDLQSRRARGPVSRTRPRRSSWWPPTPGGGRSTGPRTPPTAAGKAAPRVGPPLEVPRRPTIGPAAAVYPDQLMAVPGPRILDAGVLATAGPGLPDAGSAPLYLRRPDATEPTRRKSVLPSDRARRWSGDHDQHRGGPAG